MGSEEDSLPGVVWREGPATAQPKKTGADGRLGVWSGGLGGGESFSSLPDDMRF